MYFRPAEWCKNKTIWLAWPFDPELWGEDLAPAQGEFLALIKALKREQLVVIAPSQKQLEAVSAKIGPQAKISYQVMPYGDIWLRDTFPVFVKDQGGVTSAILPRFNGWGNKYLFEHDLTLSARVTSLLKVPAIQSPVVFEGGAIECDGEGTMLTTEQCLLNKNRNPTLDKRAIEGEFANCFGAKKVIWIKQGLKNDHTDGHVDTIARFMGPHKVAIMVPQTKSDPNFDVLMAIKCQLKHESDAHQRKIELLELPSCGEILNGEGMLMPASYLNFIMGDETLVVPLYGSVYDQEAMRIFSEASDLAVVGLNAKSILTGGGAFHCISQEFYR